MKIDTTEDGTITMSQPLLTDAIIQELGLEDTLTQHQTHVVSPPLYTHEDKDKFNEAWNCRSLICFAYLARNTRPDIEYSVH